jgi:hypothetical protein
VIGWPSVACNIIALSALLVVASGPNASISRKMIYAFHWLDSNDPCHI